MTLAAKRILAVLEEGGPRKPNVLKGMLRDAEAYKTAIAELRAAKLVRTLHRNGGPHVALARR